MKRAQAALCRTDSFGCSGGHFPRRDFLRVGALSFLGISLSQYLELKNALAMGKEAVSGAKAQACILLFLNGGPSHLDTWDPKKNSSFKPIHTNVAGIQISELLPRVARHMDKLAIIRSMHTEENNHGVAHHYLMTGHRPSPAMKFPSLGSIITKEKGSRNSVPPHVMVPGFGSEDYHDYFRAHFLGPEYDPLIVPDPNTKDFKVPDLSLPESVSLANLEDRRSFLKIVDGLYRKRVDSAQHADLDSFREEALNMVLSPAVRDAFDLSKESEMTKDAYGHTVLGQSVLLARRLVEAGSRFVTAGGAQPKGWDTHSNNDKTHRDILVPDLDRSLSALLEDLTQRGLIESTIVVVTGEFGRTPDINAAGGRDHWSECWSLVMGGGGIRGGQVVGESDERGAYVSERMVAVGDVFATLYKALGIDWSKEYMHPIGRPLKIANSINDMTGTPIQELI